MLEASGFMRGASRSLLRILQCGGWGGVRQLSLEAEVYYSALPCGGREEKRREDSVAAL